MPKPKSGGPGSRKNQAKRQDKAKKQPPQIMSDKEFCEICGKPADLAPCYRRPGTGQVYHYQCIMLDVELEKPIALEKPTPIPTLSEFGRLAIENANKLRALHRSPPLTWSKALEEHAQKWCQHLLDMNYGRQPNEMELQHDSYQGMGENLYVQSVGSTLSAREAALRVTNNWYSEEDEFDYDANEFTHDTSHFCQLVWKGTWKVGMATVQKENVFVTVANFWPAGNITGWFIDHVQRKEKAD